MKYYNENTQEVLSASWVRKAVYPSSLPRDFGVENVVGFGIKAYVETEKPAVSTLLKNIINGDPVQTEDGNWEQTWVEVDKFSDYTDDEGVLHTKEEQETAYLAQEFLARKAAIQSSINALFISETAALKGNVQQAEVDTFDSQKEEAIAYQADPSADTPLLSGLATVRGLTVAELAERVLGHAAAYKEAMGLIMGKKHSFEDQLAAAVTIEDLDAINVV